MRTYGFDKTIHGTTHLDVEVNKQGKVVAVWFRCQTLPFQQCNVDKARSDDMSKAYTEYPMPELHAVKLKDQVEVDGKQ